MFQRTKICLGVTAALGGALMTAALPSVAQTAPPAASAQSDLRIQITGSLIRRIDGETSLPTVSLKTEELQRAGATNAESVVKYITQQQGGTVTSGSVSGTNGAAAYVDLRSLGANRTLVLLNGKRVVTNPFSSAAVDLNTLPIAAVDKVDTLPDGASATYGTDAIAGVVNFITRRSFKGVSLGASGQVTQDGGSDVATGDILGGIGNLSSDGWNVYVGLNIRDQKPMNGTARDFMKTSYIPQRGFNGLSPTTFPANYTQGSVTANPSLGAGCAPPESIAVPEANGTTIRCFADTQNFTNVVPIQKQWGAFLKGTLALGSNHSATFEYLKAYNEVETRIAPSPEGGLTMFPNSPYYPGNGVTPANPAINNTQPISVSWRTTVLGSRGGVQENDTQRAVASLDGTLAGWDYSAALLWSNSTVTNSFLSGYPMTQPLRNGVSGCNVPLVAGACPAGQTSTLFLNPFGPQTAAGQAYFQQNQVLGKVQDGEGTIQSLSATVSRPLFKLPGGSASLALTAEYREEENRYFTDVAKVSQAASSGLAGAGALRQGERDISAYGIEVNMPVLKQLELNLSVRSDRYSDFGTTTNPKFSFRFKPVEQVLLRGSYNEGFAAASLTNMFLPQSTTFTGTRYNDPVLCPNGVVNLTAGGNSARDCGIQFQQLQGGNPDLKPERSSAWTVGMILQPTPQFAFGFDYWNYRIKDSIGTTGEQTIFGDPAKYSALFVRCSQAPAARRQAIGACQITGGDPLAYIINTTLNLGETKTEGVDLQANWTSGATSTGRFGITYNGTYVTKYHFQVEPAGRWFDPVGNYSAQFGGPVIRYQHVARFSWDAGNWSTRVGNRFLSRYRDQNTQGAPFNVAPFNQNVVSSYSLWDLSIAHTGLIKGLTMTAGMLNVLDTDPPFTNQTSRFQARGYDDRFSDPRGRTFQVGARYEF
jgi:iron complex outermembrane recepter protein